MNRVISNEELARERRLAGFNALTFDEWEEKYQPVANVFNQDASFDGRMYETYGAELAQVQTVAAWDATKVWTLLDCDGELYVSAGLHYVNRFGYFITSVGFDVKNPPEDFPCDEVGE